MADRRAELERKKIKLQQLREMKEAVRNNATRDRAILSDLNLGSSNTTSMTSPATSIRTDMSEVDQLLNSIGVPVAGCK